MKGESELVALINSTISHEMRNPLNIIINHCKIIRHMGEKFADCIKNVSGQVDSKILNQLNEFYNQIVKSNDICCYSSDKLILNIEDLLCFAQLKSGSFYKQNQIFNVQKCVQEIIMIQKYQADSKNVELVPHYFDFPKLKTGG